MVQPHRYAASCTAAATAADTWKIVRHGGGTDHRADGPSAGQPGGREPVPWEGQNMISKPNLGLSRQLFPDSDYLPRYGQTDSVAVH